MGLVIKQPKTSMEGEFTMYLPPQFNLRTGQLETNLDIPRRNVFEEIVANTLAAMPFSPTLPMPAGENGHLTFSAPSAEARWIAELVGDLVVGEEIDATTDHAWLVVMGYLGQALGLIAELEKVPIRQRKGPKCKPQTKLIELLVGILGGIEYLQDLSLAENPIAKDPTIAEAWAQELFVHYSNVSRTLDASDEETLAAIIEVLQEISRPFIEAAVMETLKREGRLTVDVDLTGREVSPTSTDYQDATFGYMDDGLAKGYQDAVTSLVCERWTRLMLTLLRYTGRTKSAECLQESVLAVEDLLGVRPRRRVELVKERRDVVARRVERKQEALDRTQQGERQLWQRIGQAKAEAQSLREEIQRLETEYEAQNRQERKHCRLAKARRKLDSAQKREQRAWRDLQKLQRRQLRQQVELDKQQKQWLILDERIEYLDTDNQHTPNPVDIVLRIDAGFSTGPNMAWLIEMGYIVLTKAHNGATANSLKDTVSAQTEWTTVGRNAEAVYLGDYQHNDCPYPLQTMLVRYYLPDKLRHTVLFYYGDTPPPSLPAWFAGYNARQTIEAGIKEGKGVFTLKRHLVRSPFGMQIQEQFALFAANFVRWAAAWVKDCLREANGRFITALDQVKTLVKTVSRARARWVRNVHGHTLIFSEKGPFAGTVLCLSGQVAVQLTLPLFKFAPS
jgi:hypothetical protein